VRRVSEYIRLVTFVAGVLVGIQLPGFVDQYGKALQAHQRESAASLREFQDDAERYFGGSLEKLAEYYRSSPDEVFNAGGLSIGALAQRNEALTRAVNRFYQSPYSPYLQTLLEPVDEIRRDVIDRYTYTVVLNGWAIGFGLLSGFVCALLLDLLWGGTAHLTRRCYNLTKGSTRPGKSA